MTKFHHHGGTAPPRTYSVRDIFDTFQGEGSRAGSRAVFVRVTGCNQWNGNPEDRHKGRGACAQWCDTDFQRSLANKLTAMEIAERCEALWPETKEADGLWQERWIVLTGGEPLLQVDEGLLFTLRDYGFKVAVETNGTVPLPSKTLNLFEHICVSPKLTADGTMPELVIRVAHELKVVLPGIVNGIGWTDEMLDELASCGSWISLSVQPMDPTDPSIVEVSHLRGGYSRPQELSVSVQRCLDFVKSRPQWRVGVQMHKVLNLP